MPAPYTCNASLPGLRQARGDLIDTHSPYVTAPRETPRIFQGNRNDTDMTARCYIERWSLDSSVMYII